MNKADFLNKMESFNLGDPITLTIRGNYGIYKHSGILRNVERGYVYLNSGFAHSYRRIIKIKFGREITRK